MEILFQLVAEALLSLLAEIVGGVAEAGSRKVLKKPDGFSPLAEILVWLSFGVIAAILSLWMIPQLAIKDASMRIFNLLLSPLIAATALERWRAMRSGTSIFRRDTWAYAWVFACVFCAIRFMWGK